MSDWKWLVNGGVRYVKLYRIHPDGRVQRRIRKGVYREVRFATDDNKVYPYFTISARGRCTNVRVHIAMYETFVGFRRWDYHVNHIDGNTRNPALFNLELISARGNAKHAISTNLRSDLSHDQVRDIVYLLKNTDDSIRTIAKNVGLHHTTVAKIQRGVTYTHITHGRVRRPWDIQNVGKKSWA